MLYHFVYRWTGIFFIILNWMNCVYEYCCVFALEWMNVFINSSHKKIKKATAKGMDGQNTLTAYTITAHHVTHKNLLKSKQFSLALKE